MSYEKLPEACEGCIKVEKERCIAYEDPHIQMRWAEGESLIGCGINYEQEVVSQKRRVGQQKHKRK